jgi:hypothetical protein
VVLAITISEETVTDINGLYDSIKTNMDDKSLQHH